MQITCTSRWDNKIFSTLSDWMRTDSSFGERAKSISLSKGHAVSGERTNFVRFEDPRKESLASSGGASFTQLFVGVARHPEPREEDHLPDGRVMELVPHAVDVRSLHDLGDELPSHPEVPSHPRARATVAPTVDRWVAHRSGSVGTA